MGTIMMVVAVLLSHIESTAVASMNPPTSRLGAAPTAFRMVRAMRRCRFQRSTALAMRNPPRKRKISGCA
jgi:hypothetical protein